MWGYVFLVVQIHEVPIIICVLYCCIVTARPLIVVFDLDEARGVILLGLTLEAFVPGHLALSIILLLVLNHTNVVSFLATLGLER